MRKLILSSAITSLLAINTSTATESPNHCMQVIPIQTMPAQTQVGQEYDITYRLINCGDTGQAQVPADPLPDIIFTVPPPLGCPLHNIFTLGKGAYCNTTLAFRPTTPGAYQQSTRIYTDAGYYYTIPLNTTVAPAPPPPPPPPPPPSCHNSYQRHFGVISLTSQGQVRYLNSANNLFTSCVVSNNYSVAINSDYLSASFFGTAMDNTPQGAIMTSNLAGNNFWTLPNSGGNYSELFSAPAIDHNGYIYFGDNRGYLYAEITPTSATPQRYWALNIGGDLSKVQPVIDKDGIIYQGSYSGYVTAVNPDGTYKWQVIVDSSGIPYPAALDPITGTIYVVSSSGSIYALDNTSGKTKWSQRLGVVTAPTVGADGTVYVGTAVGYIYALEGDSHN